METDREFKLIVESCVAENLDLAILVCFLKIIILCACMYVCPVPVEIDPVLLNQLQIFSLC